MIYVHSLGRAARYYGERIALSISGKRLTFRELHDRVKRIATDLNRRGLRTGDRLAILLPNGPEYIELVYACSRLGVIAVPVNPRYSPRGNRSSTQGRQSAWTRAALRSGVLHGKTRMAAYTR